MRLFNGQQQLGILLRLGEDGLLSIGGVVSGGTQYDRVLACVCDQYEFTGVLAADSAAVRLNLDGFQTAAAEYVAICLRHSIIGNVESALIDIEAISVLHVELAHTNQTAAWSRLIAELRLNLVDDEREVAVAVDVRLDHVGQKLFVRGREHKRALSAIVQPEEFAAHCLASTGLVPEFERLQRGHHYFLSTGSVHLLADNLLNLAQGAQSKRHVAVHAR